MKVTQYSLGVGESNSNTQIFNSDNSSPITGCVSIAVQAPPGTNIRLSGDHENSTINTVTVGMTGIYQLSFFNMNTSFRLYEVSRDKYDEINEAGSAYIIVDVCTYELGEVV